MDDVWPLITARVPEAKMTVVGRAPPSALVQRAAARASHGRSLALSMTCATTFGARASMSSHSGSAVERASRPMKHGEWLSRRLYDHRCGGFAVASRQALPPSRSTGRAGRTDCQLLDRNDEAVAIAGAAEPWSRVSSRSWPRRGCSRAFASKAVETGRRSALSPVQQPGITR